MKSNTFTRNLSKRNEWKEFIKIARGVDLVE